MLAIQQFQFLGGALMPRRRKSNAQKGVEGTFREDRAHVEAELPAAKSFKPPEGLISPDAIKLWKKVTKILAPVRLLSDADLDLLLHYCNLHAKCLKLWAADETPTASMLTQLRLMASEFGLTPASRSRTTPIGGIGASSGSDKPADAKSPDRYFDGPKLA